MVVSGIADSGLHAGELAAESTMFFVCAAVLGAQAIGVGLILNRRNDRAGYWINLVTLGAVDAAFIPILIVPGHIDLISGISGPALWLVAAAASTVARRRADAAEVRCGDVRSSRSR